MDTSSATTTNGGFRRERTKSKVLAGRCDQKQQQQQQTQSHFKCSNSSFAKRYFFRRLGEESSEEFVKSGENSRFMKFGAPFWEAQWKKQTLFYMQHPQEKCYRKIWNFLCKSFFTCLHFTFLIFQKCYKWIKSKIYYYTYLMNSESNQDHNNLCKKIYKFIKFGNSQQMTGDFCVVQHGLRHVILIKNT